jgi:hypothetical protein
VYLTDEERNTFASKPLSYLVRQVTRYTFPNIGTRQLFDLYTQNPIPRLIVLPRRTDSVIYRNDWTNYTNWLSPSAAPFVPNASGIQGQSGLLVVGNQQGILQQVRVLCDGNELQEPKPLQYFNELSAWKYADGIIPQGLAIYSFALNTSSWIKPSGTLNTSRVKNFQIDVAPGPLIASNNYLYDINVFVEALNFFVVEGGMGGVKYQK